MPLLQAGNLLIYLFISAVCSFNKWVLCATLKFKKKTNNFKIYTDLAVYCACKICVLKQVYLLFCLHMLSLFM